MNNVCFAQLTPDGYAVRFSDYKNIIIPKDCVGFSLRVVEDFCATGDERESIVAEEGNPVYKSVDNCLIEIATGKVVLGCKNSKIPDDGSIKIIGAHAFSGIGSMYSENRDVFKTIHLPHSIEIIEHHAFADSGLEKIYLPDNLKKIGSMAFMMTRLGKEWTIIPEKVEEIGFGIFCGISAGRFRVDSKNPFYKSESCCIYGAESKNLLVACGGKYGMLLPEEIEIVEPLCFMGQEKGTKQYFGSNVREIQKHYLNLPTQIEFPITICAPKDSYPIKFAKENNIEYEER